MKILSFYVFLPCIILSELTTTCIQFTCTFSKRASQRIIVCQPLIARHAVHFFLSKCSVIMCVARIRRIFFRVICQDFQLAHMYALASGGTGQCYFIFAGCEVIQCVYYACIIQYSKCLHVSTCALWTLSCNGKRCHFVRYVLSHDFDGK